MLERLRGRNLAHVGCTIGLTVGLLAGLIAGIVILQVVPSTAAPGLAAVAWLGLTVVLGVTGYSLGAVLTRRLWGSVPGAQTDTE